MRERHNRVVQLSRYGEPDELEVVDRPLPETGRGEVRVRVLASGIEYTDVVIRRHLYPQTMLRRPPFVMGYDVVHRAAHVQRGQRALVQGAAAEPARQNAREVFALIIDWRGAQPADERCMLAARSAPQLEVIFDGVGEDGYRRSFAALKLGGLLCAYGYTANVNAQHRLSSLLMSLARVYLGRSVRSWLPGGKRIRVYSINAMRARHPAWFREDLERLFGLLATGAIRPRVAERISFEEVAEAHRRLEAGGLEGKLVLCPDLPSRGDGVPPEAELRATSVQAPPPTSL